MNIFHTDLRASTVEFPILFWTGGLWWNTWTAVIFASRVVYLPMGPTSGQNQDALVDLPT